MQNALNRLNAEAPDDLTSEVCLIIAEEKLESFFELFVGLENLLSEFDGESTTAICTAAETKKEDPPKRADPLKILSFFDFTGFLISQSISSADLQMPCRVLPRRGPSHERYHESHPG